MKRLKHNFKKIMAFVLFFAMISGLIPTMQSGANKVKASDSKNRPSVSAYATASQMMSDTFTPNTNGEATNYGKLVFGNKKISDGTYSPLEWYILGKDTASLTNNIIIFAATPIEEDWCVFEDATPSFRTDQTLWSDCDYSGTSITKISKSHYGASDLRDKLQAIASDTNYFTTAEQGLMNSTKVTTRDVYNQADYTTQDKLYALSADGKGSSTITAGTKNNTVLNADSYWNTEDCFWLRSSDGSDKALHTYEGSVDNLTVEQKLSIRPASNLNLSSVLFASAATPAAAATTSGKITAGTAMTLRMDGTGKNIGETTYNSKTGDIKATKGSIVSDVSLIVQGNDRNIDWYYTTTIGETKTINVSEIKSSLENNGISLASDIDLSACQIWLEVTDSDELVYAVNAKAEKINTTYVTKEQLMESFTPNSEGTAVNIGKIIFGHKKNSDSTYSPLEWYVLGKDDNITGDNTIIFASDDIVKTLPFNDSLTNKTDATLWSDCNYNGANITSVYPNHYGASNLRKQLQSFSSNTSYFTTAEQGLMNSTTVTTQDTLNSVTYTTTDKLYALHGTYTGLTYYRNARLYAGTNDCIRFLATSYCQTTNCRFWLRSPDNSYSTSALYLTDGWVDCHSVIQDDDSSIRPASNLNLSSVLFASAVTPATSATASGMITAGSATTLRMDGSSKNIGQATYSITTGDININRGSTTGDVYFVIQGNDGISDWYYNTKINESKTINVSDIESALENNGISLASGIDLSDCQIWLEMTDTDELVYAVHAIGQISSVAITDIVAPTAESSLKANATCTCTGVSSTTPQITWTPADTTACYNTIYTASITLTPKTDFEFESSVNATVNGESATSVTKNVDGTLTVTYEFPATSLRKIDSVTAPAVPADNTFTTFYGFDGYAANPTAGNNSDIELGKTANVTFEGTMSPTAQAMDVIWTVANEGNADYDKTPGAENTFRWEIPFSALANYNPSACAGYDASSGTITGTVQIKNKAALPVNITGTDGSIAYTGSTIDISQYFAIDSNAGNATYYLLTNENGTTGEGTLNGTTLTVTKAGTFKIKVETLANGIYAAGEATITLTVDSGTIHYTSTDYSGTYDGQTHSVSVNVTSPDETNISYSTDGINYVSDNPSFSDVGTYNVYYRITKDNYSTIDDYKTVTINKKSATITAETQDIYWGDAIDTSKFTADGLVTGDSVKEITLAANTTALTDSGIITISAVNIENASEHDVTDNYDITLVSGTVKIAHNTSLAPTKIEAVKTKTAYMSTDTLNVDDITVTAYYADGYSESVTDFTTNANSIDIQTAGTKTLTVSYTKNKVTKTADISINITDVTAPTIEISLGTNRWNQFLNTVTFGFFFKNTKEITITASDNATKAPEIKYYLSDKQLTEAEIKSDNITWTDYTKAFTLNKNSKTIIYAKATDESGNVTIVNSEGIVIYTDSIADTASVTYIKNLTTDVTADVKLNQNTVANIKNEDSVLGTTDYAVEATADGNGKITLKEDYLKTLENGTYTLTVSYNPMEESYSDGTDNEAPLTTQFTLIVRNPKLTGITNPEDVTGVANGVQKTEEAFCLPKTITITIEDTTVTSASVTWDLENLAEGTYEPSVSTLQSFKVNGTVILPDGIDNTDNINVTVTVQITVDALEVVEELTPPAITTQPGATATPDTVDYEILDGADSIWETTTDAGLSIRGSGEFSKFIGVKVDGTPLDANNYTVEEGSTIITLNPDYLATLAVGEHNIEIIWEDGSASTTFTIKADSSDNDNNNQDDTPDVSDNIQDDTPDVSDNIQDVIPSVTDNIPDVTPNVSDNNQDEKAPSTGDDTPVGWLFILSIISGTGLILTSCKHRKKES